MVGDFALDFCAVLKRLFSLALGAAHAWPVRALIFVEEERYHVYMDARRWAKKRASLRRFGLESCIVALARLCDRELVTVEWKKNL